MRSSTMHKKKNEWYCQMGDLRLLQDLKEEKFISRGVKSL